MSKLVLQINSVSVLERLIGGDTEVEIDIRNNVVQAFTDKHLKALASHPSIVGSINEVKKAAEKAAAEVVLQKLGKLTGPDWARDVKLNPDIIAAIRHAADDASREAISKAVRDAVASYDSRLEAMVARRVEQAIDSGIQEIVTAKTRAVLEKALNTGA